MAIPGPVPRRLLSVGGATVAVLISSFLLPVAVPVLIGVDVLQSNRLAKTRAFLALWVLAVYEIAGVLAAGAIWTAGRVLRPPRDVYEAWNMRLTYWWGSALFRWIVRLYSLEVRITGAEQLLRPGKLLFLMRHAGVADTLVSPAVISTVYGRALRYIVKEELLWDPCLDIVGNRFPNVFVKRDGTDTRAQLDAIHALVGAMRPEEGVILYPEGTRFTAAKRARVIEKLRASGDAAALARAENLKRVLPPRKGGSLAVLQAAPDADVVITGNVGFEWATTRTRLWTGGLIGRTIHVDFRRIPAHEVPRDDDEALVWLGEQWTAVDRWVQDREETE